MSTQSNNDTNNFLTEIASLRSYFIKNKLLLPTVFTPQFVSLNNWNPNNHNYPTYRKSLLKTDYIKRYGLISSNTISPPSSGEESDIEDIRENMPSVFDVEKSITDANTIMIVKDSKKYPKEATPSLILVGIDDYINDDYVKLFLSNVPPIFKTKERLEFISIKIFHWNSKRCAWVKMKHFSQCETITNYFNSPIKQNIPTLNTKSERIDVYLAYDLFEITLSNWFGLVFRNLPPNCTDDNILQFCNRYRNGIVRYCTTPVMIKSFYCCVVVTNELEDAEFLCMKLNGEEVTKNRKIKVHFHPKICKLRNWNNLDQSEFKEMFNKNGLDFEEELIQSGEIVKESISLGSLYVSADTKKTNEIKKVEEGEIKETVSTVKNDNKVDKGEKFGETNKANTNSDDNNEKKYLNKSLLSRLFPANKENGNNEETNNGIKSQTIIKDNNAKMNHSTSNNIILKAKSKEESIKQLDSMSSIWMQMVKPQEGKKKDNDNPNKPRIKKENTETMKSSWDVNHNQTTNQVNKTKTESPGQNTTVLQPEAKQNHITLEDLSKIYDASEIKYYTYNMRTKEYYDKLQREAIENEKRERERDRIREREREWQRVLHKDSKSINKSSWNLDLKNNNNGNNNKSKSNIDNLPTKSNNYFGKNNHSRDYYNKGNEDYNAKRSYNQYREKDYSRDSYRHRHYSRSHSRSRSRIRSRSRSRSITPYNHSRYREDRYSNNSNSYYRNNKKDKNYLSPPHYSDRQKQSRYSMYYDSTKDRNNNRRYNKY